MRQILQNSTFEKMRLMALLLLLFFLNPVSTQNQINQAYMIFSDACPPGYTDVSSTQQHRYTTGFYQVTGMITNCNPGDDQMYATTFGGDSYSPGTIYLVCAAKNTASALYPYRISEPGCNAVFNAGAALPACPLSASGYNFVEITGTNFLLQTSYGPVYVSCRHCYERVKLCQWNP